MKTFMLIGSSYPNVPMIQMARDIGYDEVVVTDIRPEAPGLRLGDYNYVISAKDIEGLAKIAMKHNVACAYSSTDFSLSIGVINNVMGIKSVPLRLSIAGAQKDLFRDMALEAGILIPKGVVVKSAGEALNAFYELGSPVVVKAVDLSSCLGVKKARTEAEVIDAYHESIEVSNRDEVIVEEFINGRCHDANALVVEGEFFPCGVIDRAVMGDDDYFIHKEITCPSVLDKDVRDEMYRIMSDFCKKLGVVTSPIKADFFYDGHQLYLSEFNPRFHGSMSFLHIVPNALGIYAMEAYLQYRLTGFLDETLLEETGGVKVSMKPETHGKETSNYDMNHYIVDIEGKEPVEIFVR